MEIKVQKAVTTVNGVTTVYPYSEVELDKINAMNIGISVAAFLTKQDNLEKLVEEESMQLNLYVSYLDSDDDSGTIVIELNTL